jgi:hypothetical protein
MSPISDRNREQQLRRSSCISRQALSALATNGVLVALTSLYPNLKAEAEAAVPNRQIVTITALAQLRGMRRADFARLLIRAAKRRKKPRGRKMPTHIARGSATRGRLRSRVELRSALDRSPATFAANAPLFVS